MRDLDNYFCWILKASSPKSKDDKASALKSKDDNADFDVESVYLCALAHGLGIGTSENNEEFLEKTVRAVKEGHESAFMAVSLAKLRKYNSITKKNINEILTLFEKLRMKVLERKAIHKLQEGEIEELKRKDLDGLHASEVDTVRNGIAHFISIDALYSMLPLNHNGHTDRSQRNLVRLYNVQYFNDPQEGQLLLDRNIPASKLIRAFFLHAASNESEESVQSNAFESLPLLGLAFSVYVSSFTLRTDFLDLWRAYGRDGKGYCIVTPFDSFSKAQTKGRMSFAGYASRETTLADEAAVLMDLYKVHYGTDEATATLIELSEVLESVRKVYAG